jgi:5-methylcytosine-specific restriction endonuclease McrA
LHWSRDDQRRHGVQPGSSFPGKDRQDGTAALPERHLRQPPLHDGVRLMPRAPRRCPGDDHACPNLVRNAAYCPDHTKSWKGKRTKSGQVTSTAAWKRLRLQILKRDNYRCQERGPRCTGRATQVDHIVNVAAGGAELDPANLQSICPSCNAIKASREAAKARNAWKRQPERHPGLIR